MISKKSIRLFRDIDHVPMGSPIKSPTESPTESVIVPYSAVIVPYGDTFGVDVDDDDEYDGMSVSSVEKVKQQREEF